MASAADIITYIGVPLAVLGVSPILYNFLIAFLVKWSIQRKISAVGLQKDVIISTRLMNGIAEVELPIYQISLDNILSRPTHPASQQEIRLNRVPNVRILSGGSWVPLTYDDNVNLVGQMNRWSCLRRSRTGSIKQEFKLSSELILPEATIRFEDLLKFFMLFGCELDRASFKLLRHYNTEVPPNTRLIRLKPANKILTKSKKSALKSALKANPESETNSHMFAKDTVYLCTTKSSMENLTSLTLRFENILAWLPEHERIRPRENFFDNEIKRYVKNDHDRKVLFNPHMSGTNRYFIPEPHPQALLNLKARETAGTEATGDRDFEETRITSKLEEGEGTRAGVSSDISRSVADPDLTTDPRPDRPPGDLQEDEPDSKEPSVKAEGNLVSKPLMIVMNESKPPTSQVAVAGSDIYNQDKEVEDLKLPPTNTLRKENDHAVKAAPSELSEKRLDEAKTAAGGIENSLSKSTDEVATPRLILNSTVESQKGLYVRIRPSGLYQAYLLTSACTDGDEIPSHLIEIDDRILKCDLLQHALSATLELQDFSDFPIFKYEPDLLYGCLNCFFDAELIPIAVLSALRGVSRDEIVDLNIKGGDHTNFPVHSEGELEELLKTQNMRERKRFLAANAVPLNILARKSLRIRLIRRNTSPSPIKLAELRAFIDRGLWQKVLKSSMPADKSQRWAWKFYLSQVPTAKTILYYVLTEKAFGTEVVKWLDIFRAYMFGDHAGFSQDMERKNGLHFLCAVILVDDVAKNVGTLLHVDDVRYCLRQFRTVYLQ